MALDDWDFAEKNGIESKHIIMPSSESDINSINVHPFFAPKILEGETIEQATKRAFGLAYRLVKEGKKCFTADGILVNSENFSGLSSEEARKKMTAWLEEKGLGKKVVNYRLRDWSISRQRYWGCPIPIVYSPDGEAHLVPEEHLPWTLPRDVDFHPTGVSPLAKSEELKKRAEDIFGKGWEEPGRTIGGRLDGSLGFGHGRSSRRRGRDGRSLPRDGGSHTPPAPGGIGIPCF